MWPKKEMTGKRNPMRILVVDNVNYADYPTGGIMSFYRNLLPAFGNDLLLAGITTDATGIVGKWEKREIGGTSFDYYTMAHVIPTAKRPLIPERITNCIHIKKHIRRILRRDDFDVILTHAPEVVYFIPDAYLRKTCFILPGIENPLSISRYPWARKLAGMYDRYFLMPKAKKVRWLLAAADNDARQSFSERSKGKIPASDVISFPTRYDEVFYKHQDKTKCREELGIDDDARVFVTVGRLGWFKGWKLMIDAFRIYQSTNENSHLYFIGDGEDENRIRSYIEMCHLKHSVFLVGKKEPKTIAVYLNAADVFVMGSMVEGWSTTLVEACACGVPCVVTNFSSAKEMVHDGINGFVVDERNEKRFAEKMIEALKLCRDKVVEYDKRYEKYAIRYLKKDLLEIIGS